MSVKTCPNGHKYDADIYGNNCPFCPAADSGTKINDSDDNPSGRTVVNSEGFGGGERPTVPVTPASGDAGGGGRTVIRSVNGTTVGPSDGGRHLVGLLVTYSHNPLGEVFKIYEGRNFIGRDATCDIPITADPHLSSRHLLILYREGEGVFWATDQDSSNGTYINGEFAGERIKIKTNDVIVIGATKLVFLAIPQK